MTIIDTRPDDPALQTAFAARGTPPATASELLHIAENQLSTASLNTALAMFTDTRILNWHECITYAGMLHTTQP